jgi:DNA-binding LytR/AlgR family response regulator
VQQGLREPTSGVREARPGAAGASPTAAISWPAIARVAAICLLFGVFLTFVGVRTSAKVGFIPNAAYMTGISLAGFLTAYGLWRALLLIAFMTRHRWLVALIAGLVQAPMMAVIVWTADNLLTPGGRPVSLLPSYLTSSLAISIFMNLMVNFMMRDRIVVIEKLSPVASVRFAERLPPKLRGAAIWAVEAEDHYLRLHTSRGQDLILMRLSDAIAELDGIEGAQVHRSWWVARSAIADIARADGRATLTLQDGSEVPVSRTYAKLLREAGWL